MIKKASQKNKSPEQKMMEESVKVSYEENDESLSMSPFFWYSRVYFHTNKFIFSNIIKHSVQAEKPLILDLHKFL